MDRISKKLGFLTDPRYLLHLTGNYHPEKPARLLAIDASLEKSGLIKPDQRILPRKASDLELSLAHDPNYITLVRKEAERCALHELNDGSYTLSTGDVQICGDSYNTALLATGGALAAVDALMEQQFSSMFCAIRPPGHHACFQKGMGFCLFNHAVIAARYARKKWGMKRAIIIDWDVHHGNGTQDICWSDPLIHYFSTHQWPLYPGTGDRSEQGEYGNILNCPIEAGSGSRLAVLKAFHEELPHFFEVAAPDFVIISAGFDAHRLDPLGGMNLTKEDFGELTRQVVSLSQNRPILSLLEGGYSLEALAESAVEHCYFLGCSKL